MNGSTNPTWYDILGVSPEASAAEIKAAWTAAVDAVDADAGAAQFRLFNQAADVLLDPERRRSYDAELSGSGSPVDTAAAAPAPVADVAVPAEPPEPDGEGPSSDDVQESSDQSGPEALEQAGLVARVGRLMSVWVLAALGTAIVGLTVVLTILVLSINGRVAREDAGVEAAAAAERGLAAVLSFDYRRLDADRERGLRYLTPAYQKVYEKNFTLLTDAAPGKASPPVATKAVVTAEATEVGVVEAKDSAVTLVAFINQTTVKGSGDPELRQNRATIRMVNRDGAWLIDKITPY